MDNNPVLDRELSAELTALAAQFNDWLAHDTSSSGDLSTVLTANGRNELAAQCARLIRELRFLQADPLADRLERLAEAVQRPGEAVLGELLPFQDLLFELIDGDAVAPNRGPAPGSDNEPMLELGPNELTLVREAAGRAEFPYLVRATVAPNDDQRMEWFEILERETVVLALAESQQSFGAVVLCTLAHRDELLSQLPGLIFEPVETRELGRNERPAHELFAALPDFALRIDTRAFERVWVWMENDIPTGPTTARFRNALIEAFSVPFAEALGGMDRAAASCEIVGGSLRVFVPVARLLARVIEDLTATTAVTPVVSIRRAGDELTVTVDRPNNAADYGATEQTEDGRSILPAAQHAVITAMGGHVERATYEGGEQITITLPHGQGLFSAYLLETLDNRELVVPAAIVRQRQRVSQEAIVRDATGRFYARTKTGMVPLSQESGLAGDASVTVGPHAEVYVLDVVHSVATVLARRTIRETMVVRRIEDPRTVLVPATGQIVPVLSL